MADKLLQGKVALITGAAGGIGSATAKLFAQHGAFLSLFDRDQANLESVAKECDTISSKNSNTLVLCGDITEDITCQNFIENTVKHFGKIDVLINCAGILRSACVEDKNMEIFDNIMAVNIRAVVVLTSLAIPHLKKTQGNIVSIASVAAHRTCHGISAYGMSKSAVKTFTQYAASEFGNFKVRINCISPGVIDTPIFQNPLASPEANAMFLQESASWHALRRYGQPSEIAQSILFLASDITASFITGTDILVDGGYCAHHNTPECFTAIFNK